MPRRPPLVVEVLVVIFVAGSVAAAAFWPPVAERYAAAYDLVGAPLPLDLVADEVWRAAAEIAGLVGIAWVAGTRPTTRPTARVVLATLGVAAWTVLSLVLMLSLVSVWWPGTALPLDWTDGAAAPHLVLTAHASAGPLVLLGGVALAVATARHDGGAALGDPAPRGPLRVSLAVLAAVLAGTVLVAAALASASASGGLPAEPTATDVAGALLRPPGGPVWAAAAVAWAGSGGRRGTLISVLLATAVMLTPLLAGQEDLVTMVAVIAALAAPAVAGSWRPVADAFDRLLVSPGTSRP